MKMVSSFCCVIHGTESFNLFCAFSPLVHTDTQQNSTFQINSILCSCCATWRFLELVLFDVWTCNAYPPHTHIYIYCSILFECCWMCWSQHSFCHSSEQILILTMAKMKSAFFHVFFLLFIPVRSRIFIVKRYAIWAHIKKNSWNNATKCSKQLREYVSIVLNTWLMVVNGVRILNLAHVSSNHLLVVVTL